MLAKKTARALHAFDASRKPMARPGMCFAREKKVSGSVDTAKNPD